MKRALIGACVAALILMGCSSDTSGQTDLDQRTCEIFRDIAGNVDIQTLEETRSRIEDLYNGYGRSATAAIAAGLRDVLSGLTQGDYKTASNGIRETDTACTTAGF
jgi:hypothetical protein